MIVDYMKPIKEDFEKTFEGFTIPPQEKDAIKGILNNSDEEGPPAVFYSLTHLKHNYITLTHLFNLAKLAKLGCDIIISLWDMNVLSSPYFKKMESEKYQNLTNEQYIKQKKDEIIRLTAALGIGQAKIYTSSEIWARFTQQKEPPLFTKYYSTLATIDIDEYDIDEKLNYLIQLPADIFFADFFHQIYPEDVKKPIELLYTAPQRKNLYFATRKAMYNEGIISTERPAIIMSKEIPRIEIDTQIPHWDMSLNEINHIISKWQFAAEEINNLYKNVLAPVLPELTIATDSSVRTIKAEEAIHKIMHESRENIIASTSKNLFRYFQKAKELANLKEEPKPDFYNVKNKKEAELIGTILKSKNLQKILVLANGTRSVSDIAKSINMQLSNTSQYIAKLRKVGLVAIKDKMVVRTARGVKINFEVSLSS